MKVRTKVVKMCEHCFTIRKNNRAYVYCKADPRHKQRQKFSFLASQINVDPSPWQQTLLQMRYYGNQFSFLQGMLARNQQSKITSEDN